MMSHKQLHHTDRLTTLTVGLMLSFNNDFVPIDPRICSCQLSSSSFVTKPLNNSVFRFSHKAAVNVNMVSHMISGHECCQKQLMV